MGRLPIGPGRANGALAFLQVACSIDQGYAYRFHAYTSKATVLLVSESGAEKKIGQKGRKLHFGPLI
jgi:hypothetical protein